MLITNETGPNTSLDGTQSGPDHLLKAPELFRARELFILLFQTDNPLIQLGYNQSQIKLARSIISAISEEGTIRPLPRGHILNFNNKGGYAEIYSTRKGNQNAAFHLSAARHLEGGVDGLLGALFGHNNCPVFHELDDEVLNIHLLDPNVVDLNNLRQIVLCLYDQSGWAEHPLIEESPISNLGHKVGVITTYEAAWMDEKHTKLAVRVNNPDDDPYVFIWKVLTDKPEGLTAIGRMADVSGNFTRNAKNFLEKENVRVGDLVWNPI